MFEGERLFAFDASVLISLLGSGIPDRIIGALSGKILVVEQVFREVHDDPGRRILPQEWLNELRDQGRVDIIDPSGTALLNYLELASGGLDDGEAAVLAVSLDINAVAVIDEKRARRVAMLDYPELRLSSTAELFLDLYERRALPPDILATALFDALRITRMRVIPEMLDRVISIVGVERARQCSSISRAYIRKFE